MIRDSIVDEAMISQHQFCVQMLGGGSEFGEVETSYNRIFYGLSLWPSWCERIISHTEDAVEWKDSRRVKVTPVLKMCGWL